MNLTDDEIRIKVHEALGWSRRMQGPTHYAWSRGDYWHHAHEVPNYPEDLTACAEFEATLTREERNRYVNLLDDMALESMDGDDPVERDFRWCCSPAKHRCLAYLKTKGLIP